MNMIFVGTAIVGFIILAIGGGIGYFFWISSRPRKMSWKARVYQLGDGVIPSEKDGDGKFLRNYKLSELKPYTTDVVEKIDKKSGATHYWLQKLKKAVPVVTADCVEVWGKDGKWVRVLLEGDTTTLIKPGYDKTLGKQIFKPMPHDRINMIKTEIEERKARIQDTKDVLAQIAPFVTIGMSMLALVAIVYISIQGAVKITEMNTDGMLVISQSVDSFRTDVLAAKGCIIDDNLPEIIKKDPPAIPP